MRHTYKPNLVPRDASFRKRAAVTIIHLGRPLPNGSSDLPENAAETDSQAGSPIAFPYLVLHHEEFAWPSSVTTDAGELLPHRFTHHLPKKAGLFSVALVVIRLLDECPDVIRLAALWCSDFPPRPLAPATVRYAS